jgi:serine/threonine protein kinase
MTGDKGKEKAEPWFDGDAGKQTQETGPAKPSMLSSVSSLFSFAKPAPATPEQSKQRTFLEFGLAKRRHYRDIGSLHYGKTARTVLAIHEPTSTRIALKMFPKLTGLSKLFWGSGERGVEEGLKEAAVGFKLGGGRCTTRLLDAFETPDEFCLAFPFLRGGTLRVLLDERLGKPGRDMEKPVLSELEAATLLLRMLVAVEHAHGLGLVHRDIKAENILLGSQGDVRTAVLADWGIADQVGKVEWKTSEQAEPQARSSEATGPSGEDVENAVGSESEVERTKAGDSQKEKDKEPDAFTLGSAEVASPTTELPQHSSIDGTTTDSVDIPKIITTAPTGEQEPSPARERSKELLEMTGVPLKWDQHVNQPAPTSQPNPQPHITTTLGTPSIMPPEVLMGFPSAHPADIWALGCLAYTCATGHGPFVGRDYPEIRARIADGVDWSSFRGTEGWKGFIEKCLQIRQEERWDARQAMQSEWLVSILGENAVQGLFGVDQTGATRGEEEVAEIG